MIEDFPPTHRMVRAIFAIVVTIAIALAAYYLIGYVAGRTPR
jgi:hypothetical protein